MIARIENFLTKYESLVLVILLAAVLLINSRALSWGLPGGWNPDELAVVVTHTLDDGERFDRTNFDYPSLPKYVMLFIGRITDSLGYPRTAYFLATRFFSVFLSGMIVWLAYAVVRQLGGKRWSALLAALLVAGNNQLSLNSHFAHNDLYVTFFTGITLFLSLKYLITHNKIWLYVAFFAAGLAASSKYNGGTILLVVMLSYFLEKNRQILHEKLDLFETIFVGGGLAVLGYGIGTPTALTSFLFYTRNLLPALWRHANYNRTPTSQRGWLIQWQVMDATFGTAFLILLILSLIIFVLLILERHKKGIRTNGQKLQGIILLISAIALLDLPILSSFNVQPRFFLPLLPWLAVLIAIAAELLYNKLAQNKNAQIYQNLIAVVCILVVFWGFLRVASVIVLMKNDARNPAAEFLKTIPSGASVERTFYSPNFYDRERFSSFIEYPLILLKFADQKITIDNGLEYNIGEKGVEERQPDYLIASSFIYARFANPFICERHQADCNFFEDLLAGDTNYEKIAEFRYVLPWYLPKVEINFVNPEIVVFQRLEN